MTNEDRRDVVAMSFQRCPQFNHTGYFYLRVAIVNKLHSFFT